MIVFYVNRKSLVITNTDGINSS